MQNLRFDWDQTKAEANFKKHGVSFEEAKNVFNDESAVEFYDDQKVDWEDRFLLLGLSNALNFWWRPLMGR